MKLRSILAILAAVFVSTACAAKNPPSPPLESPVAALADGVPTPSASADPAAVPASLTALRVEHVDFVAAIPAIGAGPQVPRPLYGGRAEDRPALEQLLRGLAAATPVDPAGADSEHKRVEWLDIHLINGRRIMVRSAWTCPGDGTGCTIVSGKLVIAEGESRTVVAAPDLEAFLRTGRAEAMPAVEQLTLEAEGLVAGDQASIKGAGWAGAHAYRLTLEGAARKITLTEGVTSFGGFICDGTCTGGTAAGSVPARAAHGHRIRGRAPGAGEGCPRRGRRAGPHTSICDSEMGVP